MSVTRLPFPRTPEEVALLRFVQQWHRVDWDRLAVAVVAAFQVGLAMTLTFASRALVFTPGTQPAFALWSPQVWTVTFLVGGTLTAMLAWRVTAVTQIAAWAVVIPVHIIWLGASVISAVTHKGGSAVGIVVWTALLAFTVLAALRLAIDYTTGKR